MNETYISHGAKAQSILADRYPGAEFDKLYAAKRNQSTMDMHRDAIFTLIANGIPTCTIAEALKKSEASIAYHLRWLRKEGKIDKVNNRRWVVNEK